MDRLRVWPAVLAVVVLTATACSSDVTVVESGGGPGDTTGTVRRGTLAVTVRARAADAAVAQALGRANGTLNGATVTISRVGGSGEVSVTADANGVARFIELLPGEYQVSALRPLSASEVAALSIGDRDVTAFGGAVGATVGNGASATAELQAVAGRRGSLVISQIMPAQPIGPDGNSYDYGQYLRVFNNSDTTIFLDGVIISIGLAQNRDGPSPRSCADLATWRLDPDGIWSQFLYRVPGTGREHALAPGRSATFATDAVDHRAIVSGLPDLRAADFEFVGPTDVDNPSVPNMKNIGPSEYSTAVNGRGLIFWAPSRTYVLAAPVDSSEFAITDIPVLTPTRFWRIPAGRILDIVSTIGTPEREAAAPFPPCDPFVPAHFDRGRGELIGASTSVYSFARKSFGEGSAGNRILLRTRTTAQDFERLEGSGPRW